MIAAIVGAAGLAPSYAALAAGTPVALANKECLVSAGELFVRTARARGTTILPVDSEHNAIFQLLDGRAADAVEQIVITASGGPFREWSRERMAAATPAAALAHPNWSMGPKISVDSATLMNKGLEVIEAHHLFGVDSARLDVLIHPSIHRPWSGDLPRWRYAGGAWSPRHARSDRPLPELAGAAAECPAAPRSAPVAGPQLRGARL